MADSKYIMHPTRTTKRGGGNMVPADPFRTDAEVSMDDVSDPVAMDGRNPAITTGADVITEVEASARGGV